MTEPKEAVAESLASKAQGLAAEQQYAEAVRYHRQAIELCSEVFDATQGDRAAQQLAAQALADQWGRLGGTLRRQGDLPEALAAYEEGAELERDWGLDATYNRTNAITIRLLRDPGEVPRSDPRLIEVINLLESQVEGPRRYELWAWADLGLLSLVAGRDRAAMRAYANVAGLDPERVFAESVHRVLRQVRDTVVTVNPGRAAAFDSALRQVESAVG